MLMFVHCKSEPVFTVEEECYLKNDIKVDTLDCIIFTIILV